MNNSKAGALILGLCLLFGLTGLGKLLGDSVIAYRQLERSVVAKGLSEREYPADIVIWPIQYTVAENDLAQVYEGLEQQAQAITDFLRQEGIAEDEITRTVPNVTDNLAQGYQNSEQAFRYSASQTVTVYSTEVEQVRAAMQSLGDLGRQGVVLNGNDWRYSTQYLFTRLNEVKPDMVEEATRNAREVAQKFAEDSGSRLGRIKTASQGQFSISARDDNNPHIKKVRVVNTIEYYLAD